jgi:hypothetical protein
VIGKLLYDFVQALSKFDTDAKLLLLRVLVRGAQSGDANAWLKRNLQRILDEGDAPPVSHSPRQVQVSWREVKKP